MRDFIAAAKDIHARQRKARRTQHAHMAHFLALVKGLPAAQQQLQEAAPQASIAATQMSRYQQLQNNLRRAEGRLQGLRAAQREQQQAANAASEAIAQLQVRLLLELSSSPVRSLQAVITPRKKICSLHDALWSQWMCTSCLHTERGYTACCAARH